MQSAPAAEGLPPVDAGAAGAAAGMYLPAEDRDPQSLPPAAHQPEAAAGSQMGAAGNVGGELSGSDIDEDDSIVGDSESGISSNSDDGGGGPGLAGFQDVLSSWAQAAALPKPAARRGKPGKPAVGPAAAGHNTGAAPVRAEASAAAPAHYPADATAGAQPAERRLQASSGSRHSQPSSGSSVASWLADASLAGRDRGAQQPAGLQGSQAATTAAAAATPDWLADSGSDDEQEPQWRPSAGITVRGFTSFTWGPLQPTVTALKLCTQRCI